MPHPTTLCVHASTEEEKQSIESATALLEKTTTDALSSTSKEENDTKRHEKRGSDEDDTTPWRFCCNSEAETAIGCGSFHPSSYFSRLKTFMMGRMLLRSARMASTQSFVQENITKLPDGVVVVADQQQGGRGRAGNVWDSPPGCLMFSIGYRLNILGERLPFVQYLVTLAVVKAAQEEASKCLCLSRGTTPLDLKIKWPNDVYAGPLKLGGILCHSSFRDGQFYVTVGVGINVSNDHPTTCLDRLLHNTIKNPGELTSDTMPTSAEGLPSISRELLLAGIMNHLEPMMLRLTTEGFEPFKADYYKHWLHSGQRVLVEDEKPGAASVEVTIVGLSHHGYLLSEDSQGNVHELHPDGNSLDFFKGLVRRKVRA